MCFEIILLSMTFQGQDSSVSMATCYGLDGPVIESQWGVKFSAPVQTGPGDHPASYIKGTGSFLGQSGRGVALATHPHLAPRLKKE
jgi:hypothetical protein